MVRRTLLAAVLLMLSGLLIAAVVVAAHMRSEREREEARVTHLQASIVQLNRRLRISDQIIGSLQREIDAGNKMVDGLRSQIDWDKSHLLDCWTAIARGVPIESIPVSLRSLVGAARSGATLSNFITSCASDAVP